MDMDPEVNITNVTTSLTFNVSEEYILKLLSQANPIMLGLYIPVFFLGLIANVLVMLVVFKDQYMRSVTNYFLVNLSVADLLVTLICMPSSVWSANSLVYLFGEVACKMNSYLLCISVASSIFTITAMAIDRYLAITRPFGFIYRSFTKRTTIIVIILVWITSFTIFSPMLWINALVEEDFGVLTTTFHLCKPMWQNFFLPQDVLGIIWFAFMFAIPGIIMMFAYLMMSKTLCSPMPEFDGNEGISCSQQRNRVARDRKRVASILLLLAFVFAICWLPYHIILLMEDLGMPSVRHKMYRKAKPYLLLLGHANSALNPIIYCALSRKFRKSIKDLFFNVQCFRRGPHHEQWQESTSGTQLQYLQRLKSNPVTQNQINVALSRIQHASQKSRKGSTKTSAV